jgi:Outer membrane protein beta-barrel domain
VDDDVNSTFDVNSKTSLHGSVFFNMPITANFRVQPELMYSIQGTKASDLKSPAELKDLNEYDFHYFALPIMAQYWTGEHGLYVELGPQFSYLSSANGDRLDADSDIDLKESNYVKKTDFAAAAGIGYLSRLGLGLNARYVHGFSNVWNADDAPASTKNWEYSNRTVQLSLIYHFGAGK